MVALPGGFRPKKYLDQHFLIDRRLLQGEVDLASLTRSDVVLEIGAGNGALTKLIAEKAGKVIAVEKDARLVRILEHVCPKNVQVIEGDALELKFPNFDKVMGNLPYSISSPLIFKLLDHDFELGVLCFQEEFARRMMAKTGSRDYSRISVMLALRTSRITLAMKIPRHAFWPIPDVDSSVVLLFPDKAATPLDKVSADLIRMIFCHKRKTLANAIKDSDRELTELFGVGSAEILENVSAEWSSRVFKLTPRDIIQFCRTFKTLLSRRSSDQPPKSFLPRKG